MERRSHSARGCGSWPVPRMRTRESAGRSGRAMSRRRSTRRTGTVIRSTRAPTCSSSTSRPVKRISSPTAISRTARSRGRPMDVRSRSRGRAAARVTTRGRTSGSRTSRAVLPFASPRTWGGRPRRPGHQMAPRSRATAPTRRSRDSGIRWSACGPCPHAADNRGASPNATTAARCSFRRRRSRLVRSGRQTTRA